MDFDDLDEAKKYQVPSDREIVISVDSSQDPELGNGHFGDDHGRTTPARRRSSVSGAVGYSLPPAIPTEPAPKKPWRPTIQRLVSGKPLVLKDDTLSSES